MTEFKVLTMDDYDSVIDLCKHIWDGDDYLPYVYKDWVNDKKGCFIGIEEDNKIIALGKYSILLDKQGWLEGLRVHPNHRGKKLAHKITDKMLDISKSDLINKKITSIAMATHKTTTASIHLMESRDFTMAQSCMLVFKDKSSVINSDLKNVSLDTWTICLDELLEAGYLNHFNNRIVESFKYINLCDDVFNNLKSKNSFVSINDNKYIINKNDKSCSVMCVNENIDSINLICDYLLTNNDIDEVSVALSIDSANLINSLKEYKFTCIEDFEKDCLYYLYK